MTDSEQAKAKRLETVREKRRLKREQTGDTAEAKAERRKQNPEHDVDAPKKRISRGVIFS
jgi:hypothetical protein